MSAAGDTETVVIVAGPGRDDYGQRTVGAAVETPVDGCMVAPAGSAETGGQWAATVASMWTVYLPDGAPTPTAEDRVRVRGVLCQVVGDAQVWPGSGSVVTCRSTTG